MRKLGDDPASFVVSLNLHRRHLSESQRGMVADKLATLKHGGSRDEQDANLHLEVSRAEAAKMLNVSTCTVASGAKVISEAPEAIGRAIEQGTASLSLAAQAVALPEPKKQAIAQAIPAEPKKTRCFLSHIGEIVLHPPLHAKSRGTCC